MARRAARLDTHQAGLSRPAWTAVGSRRVCHHCPSYLGPVEYADPALKEQAIACITLGLNPGRLRPLDAFWPSSKAF
jgi:hypothetical protein